MITDVAIQRIKRLLGVTNEAPQPLTVDHLNAIFNDSNRYKQRYLADPNTTVLEKLWGITAIYAKEATQARRIANRSTKIDGQMLCLLLGYAAAEDDATKRVWLTQLLRHKLQFSEACSNQEPFVIAQRCISSLDSKLFRHAAKDNNVDLMKLLVAFQPDMLNSRGVPSNRTALHIAAQFKSTEAFQFLLSQQALDLTIEDSDKNTAYYYASQELRALIPASEAKKTAEQTQREAQKQEDQAQFDKLYRELSEKLKDYEVEFNQALRRQEITSMQYRKWMLSLHPDKFTSAFKPFEILRLQNKQTNQLKDGYTLLYGHINSYWTIYSNEIQPLEAPINGNLDEVLDAYRIRKSRGNGLNIRLTMKPDAKALLYRKYDAAAQRFTSNADRALLFAIKQAVDDSTMNTRGVRIPCFWFKVPTGVGLMRQELGNIHIESLSSEEVSRTLLTVKSMAEDRLQLQKRYRDPEISELYTKIMKQFSYQPKHSDSNQDSDSSTTVFARN